MMHRTTVRIVWVLLVSALGLGVGFKTIAAQGSEPPVYVVQAGDTLLAIAARYNTSIAELIAANQLADPDRLAIGQRLVIPNAPTGVTRSGSALVLRYVAQPGDTIGSIARRWQIDEVALRRANDLALDNRRLLPGQDVLVPLTQARGQGALAELGLQPLAVVQGQAAALRLRIAQTGTVQARLAGERLAPVYADGLAWALFGIHPLTPPGITWLDVDIAAAAVPASLRDAVTQDGLRIRVPVVVKPGTYVTQYLVIPPAKGDLLQPTRLADERAKLNTIWPQATLEPQWTGVFTRPLALEFPVTSPFGTRRSYNGGPVSSFHEGQDFGAPEGTPVLAPAPGRVVLAEELAVRGNAVIIDHGAGLHTGYWHLSKIDVQPGQQVEVGDKLGEVGTTGLSTGWHLHWEARVRTTPVDPLPLLTRALP